MKKFSALILAIVMLLTLAVPALAELNDVPNSVARVVVTYDMDLYDMSSGAYVGTGYGRYTGSCVAVGKAGEPVEYFVTNQHVGVPEEVSTPVIDGVQYYAEHTNIKMGITFTNKDGVIPARLVGVGEHDSDLAVLRLDAPTTERQAIELRPFEEGEFDIGEQVYVVGFPGIADYNDTTDDLPSYTKNATTHDGVVGRVESHDHTKTGETIGYSGMTAGGYSGGALVDKNGHLVGIHFASMIDEEGFALAVSVNEVITMLDREKIEYMTVGNDMFQYIIIGVAAVVILALIVLVVLLLTRKKKPSKNGDAGHTEIPEAAPGRVLVGVTGVMAQRVFPLERKLVIGRDPRRCAGGIIFPEGTKGVSGVHCTVRFENNVVTVTDENSSFGTWIDGTRLNPGVPTTMHRGQKLYLGSQAQGLGLHSPKY